MRNVATPVSGMADFLVSIQERGIVRVLRLDGPPGDRRLLHGFDTPNSAGALVIALLVGCRALRGCSARTSVRRFLLAHALEESRL